MRQLENDLRWRIFRNASVAPSVTVSLAFLHPSKGVALVDVMPKGTAGAANMLRNSLIASVQDWHPGFLPILYHCIASFDLDAIDTLIERSFAEEPPIILDPHWIDAVERIIGGERIIFEKEFASSSPSSPRRARAATLSGLVLFACMITAKSSVPPFVTPDVAPVVTAAPDVVTAAPEATPEAAPVVVQAPLAAPTMLPPRARQAPVPEIGILLLRGNDMLEQHDVTAARLYFARAAALGSHLAMTAMGMTFDLRTLAPIDARYANAAAAASWYAKARAADGGFAESSAK